MIFIYLIMLIISLVHIRFYYKTFFVPLTIVAITWCLFPAIATTGVLGIYKLSSATHIYIVLSYFTFFFVSLVVSKQKKVIRFATIGSTTTLNNYVNYNTLFLGNLIVAVWLMTKLGDTFLIIQNYGFVYLRNIYEENFSTSTIVNIIYQWFAKPFVVASCAIFSVDILQKRKKAQIKVGIMILINVLLDTFIFAARATIVKLVIYFFFSFFFCKSRKYSKKNIALIILIVIAMMIVIVFMTEERMSESYSAFSFLDSIYMYYVAPFSLLNYYVMNPEFSLLGLDHLTFGTGMFGAIYNVIRSVLYVLLGSEYNGSDHIIQLVTQQTVRVGASVSINSACTAAYIFLRDAGLVGIIIGFGLMAYLIEKYRYKYKSNATVRYGAIYVCMLYVIFRLSMSYDFLTPSTLFSILFVVFCTRKTKIRSL